MDAIDERPENTVVPSAFASVTVTVAADGGKAQPHTCERLGAALDAAGRSRSSSGDTGGGRAVLVRVLAVKAHGLAQW